MGAVSKTRLRWCVGCVALLLAVSVSGCSTTTARSTASHRQSGQGSAAPRVDLGGLTPGEIAVHIERLAALTRQVLSVYVNRRRPSDPQYWADGSFIARDAGIKCWYCYDTPATAAAVLSVQRDGDVGLRNIAIRTWTHAIRTYLRPSGEIVHGNGSNGVGTGFFAVQLGITYLVLKPHLPAATRGLWAAAMTAMAKFLIDSGALTFYINGNVNLRQTEVMWLAWAISGQRRFYDDYLREYAFALTPTRPRWARYGLRIVARRRAAAGADEAGYLTESSGDNPGFDPSYTLLQLDTATQLYVLTHDPRYVRLMNAELNQLRPLVNADYVLDARGGSRQSNTIAFLTAAPFVLLISGVRPDLSQYWVGQLTAIHQQFVAAEGFANAGFYNGMSNWLGTAMLAVQYPAGILAPQCSPQRSPECAALV